MLAAGTKEVHEKAENTQFVKDFLRGRIRKELFKVSLLRHSGTFLIFLSNLSKLQTNSCMCVKKYTRPHIFYNLLNCHKTPELYPVDL